MPFRLSKYLSVFMSLSLSLYLSLSVPLLLYLTLALCRCLSLSLSLSIEISAYLLRNTLLLHPVPTIRRGPANPVQALVQAPGVVLDLGGPGIFCRCSQHDRGLAAGAVQKNQGGGMGLIQFTRHLLFSFPPSSSPPSSAVLLTTF